MGAMLYDAPKTKFHSCSTLGVPPPSAALGELYDCLHLACLTDAAAL